MNKQTKQRVISQTIPPIQVKEGKGAIVQRVLGGSELKQLDPFLLFDYASTGAPFPAHPHRGFETISYCIDGQVSHEDSRGHSGMLRTGDVQWMTAGKGIMHSEIPDPYCRCFQIWVNLPKALKMCDPKYQDFRSDQIPIYQTKGTRVKVIAGESNNQKGVVNTRSPITYLDAHLEANTTFIQEIPKDHQGLIFVYEGNIVTGQNQLKIGTNFTGIFRVGDGESIQINSQSEGAKFLFLSALPLNEKAFQHGPFVMDSEQRIQEAFRDYQQGINGFEGAHEWSPKHTNREH